MSQQDNKEMAKHFYRASAADFKKIPGSPIAYWSSDGIRNAFTCLSKFDNYGETLQGMTTCDNDFYLRFWHEVNISRVKTNSVDRQDANSSGKKWFPYTKGGENRKWFGNNDYLVNWERDGHLLRTRIHPEKDKVWAHNFNLDHIFREGASYSSLSSGDFSCRYTPKGFLFDQKGSMIFLNNGSLKSAIGFLNSQLTNKFLEFLCPTLDFNPGALLKIPVQQSILNDSLIANKVDRLISIAKNDWDFYETSIDFKSLSLSGSIRQLSIKATYKNLSNYRLQIVQEMQRLEGENNRLFIDAYGLQDELTPEVPLSEITLTCNPYYRYGGNLTDDEREARLQSDTIAELISYSIGCMMGRYSLDREGLVYAHAGNAGFNELVAEGAYKTFAADSDGILPLTGEHWFEDDVAARVDEFVRTVWGAETLEENLQFIADSLCLNAIKPVKKSGETSRETIRRYLSTQFYKDHLKTYKKRPIYWLFSSGKEKAFECLVYLHRYNEATLPRMRTEYVTPLLGQMASRIERLRLQQADADTAEAKRIAKDIDLISKQLTELRAFDDQLKHYADMKISLDLDDGVKVNYGKFGNLLAEVKAITGDKGE